MSELFQRIRVVAGWQRSVPLFKFYKMKISPARKSAYEILFKIEKEKAFSSVLLPIYAEKLEKKDRSLCHKLTLGVLRKQIYLDKIIEKLTSQKLKKLDLEVVLALRLGIFQLLFLDKIPAYSAINESVNLVKMARKKSASGLVNAVLRRVLREKEFEFEFADRIEKISVETSHPRWLIENWVKQFGISETEKLAIANNQTPKISFRPTRKFYLKEESKQNEIIEKLKNAGAVESEIAKEGFTAERSNETFFNLATENLIYFQDESSQLVAQIVDLKDDESFLDVCAAPGSKTTAVASKKEKVKSEKLFVAGDIYSHRVRILRENCLNQRVEFVDIVRFDAEVDLPFAEESFQVVLVDAPCSGTGTIPHNPEIRYYLQEEDFAELSEKQLAILQNASKSIKQGGRLIYSTCSLERKENEEVIREFLKDTGFKKLTENLPAKFLTEEDFARTFPQRDKTDGFFISVFKKE